MMKSFKFLESDCTYIPKEHFDYDLIMGEDSDTRFRQAYLIRNEPEQNDGYLGDSMLSKFGLQIEEQVVFVMSKRRFDETKIPVCVKDHMKDLVFYPTDEESIGSLLWITPSTKISSSRNLSKLSPEC